MNINCVEMMREIRSTINKDIQGMPYNQKRKYIDSRINEKLLTPARELSNKTLQRSAKAPAE